MEAWGSSESSVTLFQYARRHVRIFVTGLYIISICNLHDNIFYAVWHSVVIFSTNYTSFYEGWNFNSGNYLFTTDTK